MKNKMIYARELIIWILRSWPLLILGLIVAIHVAIIFIFREQSAYINKIAGLMLQLTGGLIVLQSIDSNLGLFRERGLISTIANYFREIPKLRPRKIAAVGATLAGAYSVAVGKSSRVTPTTLEDRVAELERRTIENEAEFLAYKLAMNQRLDNINNDLSGSIAATDSRLRDLTNKVENAAVGGFKQQVLGVLLAIYGSGVSVFS